MPPQSIVSGASIISFNPFRERTLERFAAPQNLIEMATFGSTPISTGLDRHWLRVSDHDWLQPLPVRDLSRHGRPNGGK
ncbi:hypothetical protein [Paraburkholderia tropica]|uniref:hypothetical protein n=1 Tax=Paraburkholderia tropica TaxID=92647 RepID=UPI001C65467C